MSTETKLSDSPVASCECGTKTPAIEHHKPGCKYRLIMERDTLYTRLRTVNQTLVESIGAPGPDTAEDAANRAVELIAKLTDQGIALTVINGRLHTEVAEAGQHAEAEARAHDEAREEIKVLRAQLDEARKGLVEIAHRSNPPIGEGHTGHSISRLSEVILAKMDALNRSAQSPTSR